MLIEDILKKVDEDKIEFVQLQFTDLFGSVKSVKIPVEELQDSLEKGTWFDGSSIEGFARIKESDLFLKPDVETYGILSWLKQRTARFICDVFDKNAELFAGAPRNILKRAMGEAEAMGYKFCTGPELEFFLFKRDANGKVITTPNDDGSYFDFDSDEGDEIRTEIVSALKNLNVKVETSHHEVAAGQHEISFKYADALATADNATTLKYTAKAIAKRHGLHATFMPKPIADQNGNGMHVHQSLFKILEDDQEVNAFYDEEDGYHLSDTARSFIAGQLEHIREMSLILNPTVNSYKRLIPGFEAPVHISWARNNRSALIRIPRHIAGNSNAIRAELRSPDPSCNIYLAFASMLEAGLDGIERGLVPPDPIDRDIYKLDEAQRSEHDIGSLPDSLGEAIGAFANSNFMRGVLGENTFNTYLSAKRLEWQNYNSQVTPWELKTYMKV